MIALFRTTAAFFISVLLIFILISSLVDREHKPDLQADTVFSDYHDQLEIVRADAAKSLKVGHPILDSHTNLEQLPDVLFYEVSTDREPIVRKISPLLLQAENWSMEPTRGGDPPYVTMARITLEKVDSKEEIYSYVVPETIFDHRGQPHLLTTYLRVAAE